MLIRRLASLTAAAAMVLSLGGCFFREHRHGCRDHETWDGNYCRGDRGYEHYWDHRR